MPTITKTEPTIKRGRGRPKKNTSAPVTVKTTKNSAGYTLPDVNIWQGYRVSAWINGGRTELVFIKVRDSKGNLSWQQENTK